MSSPAEEIEKMNQLIIAAQRIKDSVSAQDVGRALGLEMRHGRCKCPIHGGENYNCVLYGGDRGFYCHTCKAGGDVVKFIRESLGISFKDAVEWFNDTFGLGLDIDSPMDRKQLEEAREAQRKRTERAKFVEGLDRWRFDRELTLMSMLMQLEDMMDMAAPKTPEEDFSPAFKLAAEMIDTVKGMIEEIQVENMPI